MKHRVQALTLAAAVLTLGLATSAKAEFSGGYAVLGLFSLGNQDSYSAAVRTLRENAEGRGCALQVEGNIVNANGNLDLPTTDRFVLVTCASALLHDAGGRAVFKDLRSASKGSVLFGGAMVGRKNEGAFPQDGVYVFKVSEYTNRDSDKMDRDLKSLSAAAAKRPNAYATPATIEVSEATGFRTPDEVVVIHYPTAEAGPAFRKANEDIMKRIGAFNDEHISAYVYLGAVPAK